MISQTHNDSNTATKSPPKYNKHRQTHNHESWLMRSKSNALRALPSVLTEEMRSRWDDMPLSLPSTFLDDPSKYLDDPVCPGVRASLRDDCDIVRASPKGGLRVCVGDGVAGVSCAKTHAHTHTHTSVKKSVSIIKLPQANKTYFLMIPIVH